MSDPTRHDSSRPAKRGKAKKTAHRASARRAKQPTHREATRVTRTNAHETATATLATQRSRRIDVVLKGLTVAAEPPIDANPGDLDLAFRNKLQAVLAKLASAGTPFRLVEGFRTRARQHWLFGSGRPKVVPFGRPGPVLTNADGVVKLSRHQGNGKPGSGRAADCYPTRDGRVFIPPSSDPVWAAYADAVEAAGLVAGHRFPTLKDSPHCEMR